MKKSMVSAIIATMVLISAQAQEMSIGIGTTTPHVSAALDIDFDHKGLLPPRVSLTGTDDVVTIPTPAAGLVVYNLAVTGNVIKGLYVNDGSKWILVQGSAAPSSVPAGAIQAFNLPSCPSGWIAADGNNGTPDLRGEFIRGLDGGRGVDPTRTLSSFQGGSLVVGDMNKANRVTKSLYNNTNEDDSYAHALWQWDTASLPQAIPTNVANTISTGVSTQTNSAIFGVTRPRNIALLYCQKQ